MQTVKHDCFGMEIEYIATTRPKEIKDGKTKRRERRKKERKVLRIK